jgi:8-oxo-dGTP pyrophosphatase MutT (NUDIX family)
MNLIEQIQNYKSYNKQEKKDKEIFLRYLSEFDNYLDRENEYGHLTSSAFVLNEDRNKILMIHHNIYDAWGWLGGHADGDSDLLHVAIKEVKEESGINKVNPIIKDIFTLDTLPVLGHEKRGKYVPAHIHLSVAYLLEATEKEDLKVNERETGGVKWVPLSEMVALSGEPHMEVLYEKAIKKMKELNFVS